VESGRPTLAQTIESLLPRELAHELVGARVLPDNRVVDRLARLPLPYHRALALIGDADRLDVARLRVGLRESSADHLACAPPDLACVVLHPARPGVDLRVLALVDRGDPAVLVEQDEAGACGSLVDRSYVLAHRCPLLACSSANAIIAAPVRVFSSFSEPE
jgi:hypothetical protein